MKIELEKCVCSCPPTWPPRRRMQTSNNVKTARYFLKFDILEINGLFI